MLTSIKISIRLFAAMALTWLAVIVALSAYEFLSNLNAHGIRADAGSLVFYKLLNDLVFWLSAYLWLLLPFIGFSLLSVRLAEWVAIVTIVLMVLTETMLIRYFSTALVALGADLYGYSWKDIKQTVGASGGVNAATILAFAVIVALLVVLLRWTFKKVRVSLMPALVLPALSAIVILAGPSLPTRNAVFDSDFAANLTLNKSDYFFRQTWGHFFPEDDETDIYSDYYIGETTGKEGLAGDFQYPDEAAYPFFHGDSTKDVLSPFFEGAGNDEPPPNIVILLVEGLGRAFTNEGAYLGNFTPFVDSLAGKSLYWKNFLSEGGRTFAVLPSLLGSLPFGKNGFLEMGDAMPAHFSLINILKKDGYHTSFYYGGDAHFDNMDVFLRKDGIDELNDEKTFPAGYTKLPAYSGFSWGYNDKELFRRYLSATPANSSQPQLSIILTVSTHSPFKINESDKYLQQFEARLGQLGLDDAGKDEHRNFKDQYASILYTDDALRGFFAAYAKRPDYKNTIFLITGDHRMPEIPMRNKIDRYHVPLIVFSPLLKRTSDFLSVSTHFDITPSLLAFLHHAYGIARPSGSQWMGSGLDTARGFRNIHAYPMIQTKTDQADYIMGEYHLNNGHLFKLSADMNEEAVGEDDPNKTILDNAFAKSRRRNEKLVEGAKLIPDSLTRMGDANGRR